MTIYDLTKEECRELVYEDLDNDQFQIVEDKIYDNSRWSVWHEIIILDTEEQKYYSTTYAVRAIEIQDERPFDFTSPDWLEVEKVAITTYIFKPVQKEVLKESEGLF